MIERLIAGLRGADLEPTAREIADALWLADQMKRATIVQQPPGAQSISSPPSISPPPPPLFPAGSPQERSGPGATPEARTNVFPYLEAALKAGGLPFRSPTATALPGRLALGRALRPFKRRVPSRIQLEIDEDATAERIGWGLRPAVVVRPAPTRWLDLALVVDAATSMSIWRQSVAELRALLVQCGAFRDVRVYQFVSDEGGPVTLFAGMPGACRRPIGERELCDPSGRRLVLIVSDCVGPAWSDGRAGALAREWGSRGPTAILQVLPERLWDRTGLGDAPRVRLKASSPGVRNTDLQVESHPWMLTKDAAIALPIVELDAPRVAAWAAMLVGTTAIAVSGVMLSATVENDESAFTDVEADEPTADERVARFLSMATPGARRLAVLFAAAPLALPVMRIIRETMAPETTLGHLAEVFLGGLLRESSEEENAIASEHVAYDFWPGVRERLLDSANAGDATRVLEEASAYVTEHMASTLDFRALLADPEAARITPIKARDRPFATIGAEVLRRLGGEYKRLAVGLDSTLARAPDASDPAASMTWTPTFPDLPPRSTRRDPVQTGSGATDPPPNTEAEVSIDVVGSENGHWILVDGTDDFQLPQHHLELAEALGAALARAGFSLITLGGQGVAHVVAGAFMAVLRRQGYSSGIYRMLHVVPEGQRPDFQSGGRELPIREPQVSAALARADAVFRIGLSRIDGALLEGLERAGKPYLALSEPTSGPPLASYGRFVADQIRSVCARLNVDLAPSRHESLFHQVAIALEQPELVTYEQRFAEVASRAHTEVSSETAIQMVGDRRRPSHRLVGYSVVSTLPLEVLIAALVTERWTVRSFRETRPLWAALQVLRAVDWPADAGQARALAAAATSLQIELEADERVDAGGECKALLQRATPQNRSIKRATDILEIASNYEFIRATMDPGDDRTVRMTDLVEDASRFRQDPAMPEAEVWFTSGREGQRIVAIALLLGDPDPAAYRLVEDAIRRPLSPFEQYTAMRVTLRLLDYMEAPQLDNLRDAIEFQRGPSGIISRSDESRWRLSTEHLELIGTLRELSPREVLVRTAGRYLASGEQRRRRGDLDGAEEDYARALDLYMRVQDNLGLAKVHAARGTLRAHGTDVSGAEDTATSDEQLAWSKDSLPTPDDVPVADVRPKGQEATPTDADVRVLLLRGDNDRAMRSLVRAHQDALYRVARRLTRNEELAKDVVQETWIAAFKNRDQMLAVENLRAWLIRTVTHRSIDTLRAAMKGSLVAEWGVRDELISADLGDESKNALGTLTSAAERRALEECLATLDPTVTAALLMRYQDDLGWSEIARALSVPVDTIRIRVQRYGLNQLRDCLTRKGFMPR